MVTPPDAESLSAAGTPRQMAGVWARHMDRSLKHGLYNAAREHLVTDTADFNKRMVAFEVANLCLTPLSGTLFLKAAIGWVTMNQLVNFGEAAVLYAMQGLSPKERRISLFYGTQVDRLAALRVRLATSRLIKSIPAKPVDS